MAYLTNDLMKQYFDSRILVKLTDDTGILDPNDDSNIDTAIIDLYIDDATSEIANYLRHIYTDVEPGDTPTGEIVTIAARMTWCSLWERRAQEPTSVTVMRDRCFEQLHKMAVPASDKRRASTNKSIVSTLNRM